MAAKRREQDAFMASLPGARPKVAMAMLREKVAKFMISKGPSTVQAYLDGWRKMLAAKALEKAPAEVAKKAPSAQKPTALAKLIKKKRKWKKSKKSKPLYGTPTGHGTAAFRFGD